MRRVGSLPILSVAVLAVLCNLITAQASANIPLECPSENEDPSLKVQVRKNRFTAEEVKIAETLENVDDELLEIVCTSAYPTFWEFSGGRPLPEFTISEDFDRDLKTNARSLRRNCFMSTLALKGNDLRVKRTSRTGNYTCKSLDRNFNRSASRFLFEFTNGTIFNANKTLQVNSILAENQPEVIIPCQANVANLNASIYLIDEAGNFTDLDTNISAGEYNPKTGFILRGANHSSLVGSYACSASYKNYTDVVRVTVSPPKLSIISPAEENVTFQKNTISLVCNATEPVEIELGKQSVYVEYQIRESIHNTTTFIYSAEAKLFRPKSGHAKGEFRCIKKGTKEVLWTWRYDSSHDCNCWWSPSDEKIRCSSETSGNVTLSYITCGNPLECRLKLSFTKYERNRFIFTDEGNATSMHFNKRFTKELFEAYAESLGLTGDEANTLALVVGLSGAAYRQYGVLNCISGGFSSTKVISGGLDTIYVDLENVPESTKNVQLEGKDAHVFVQDKIKLVCSADTFHLTNVRRYAFIYKNGTIGFVGSDNEGGLSNGLVYHSHDTVTVPSNDVVGAMCFVPEWSTMKWHNASIPLTVQAATPVDTSSNSTCEVGSSPVIFLEKNDRYQWTGNLKAVTNLTAVMTQPEHSSLQVRLTCRDKYPVQWLMNGKKVESVSKRIPCEENGGKERGIYESVYTLEYADREHTGFYNCTRVSESDIHSHVFLFVNIEKEEPEFVNRGSYTQIRKNIRDEDPRVTFPCGVDTPDITPYLFLDYGKPRGLERIEIGQTYDARVGFQVDVNSVADKISTFMCSLKEDGSKSGVFISLFKEDK